MLLTIDNLDGAGPLDYTPALAAGHPPKIQRKLNLPSVLDMALVATGPQFVVPAAGGRITIQRSDGAKLFTGYLMQAPQYEYLGWGQQGPLYRYTIKAESDELLLDRKMLPQRAPFIMRSAGNALKQLTQDLLPGFFNTSAVQDVATLPHFTIVPEKTWSHHAFELALSARAAYRAHDGALIFAPLGAASHSVAESDANFSPDGLKLLSPVKLINDVTLTGALEPQAHVKNYFLGDGLTLRFALSHKPFTQIQQTLLDEEYVSPALDPTDWSLGDSSSAVSVSGGRLQVQGGTGTDGGTLVVFVEQIELGGGLQLQHGEVTFSAPSTGVLGGIYSGHAIIANCVAGFSIAPSGSQSVMQPLINGVLAGTPLTTVAGHRYRLTTRLYAAEIYRQQQTYFSSTHPPGNGRGGASLPARVRVVLEVHDIDPSNPGSVPALSNVLYDGVIMVPGFCVYALVNAAQMDLAIAYTRLLRIAECEVRSAIPGQSYRTRLVGSIVDGAECSISSSPNLDFYSQYVPVANEAIAVRYRDRGRAVTRLDDPISIAAHAGGSDDGKRSLIRHVFLPEPLTQAECELAAQAVLDDATQPAWSGEYDVWSDFLPSGPASDVWPGDAVAVNVPSRAANFNATIRAVEITLDDPANDRSQYKIVFANDAALPLCCQLQNLQTPLAELTLTATTASSGSEFIADLALAEITAVTSTTVSMDVGVAPPSGGGIEVRSSDAEWGPAGDRNLLGRFTTQTFTVTRLTRLVTYYLRQYDGSNPPKYSRYSTALHVDYPL